MKVSPEMLKAIHELLDTNEARHGRNNLVTIASTEGDRVVLVVACPRDDGGRGVVIGAMPSDAARAFACGLVEMADKADQEAARVARETSRCLS